MSDERSGRGDRPGPCNILFVCTHNSARSLMAEAILNRRAFTLDRPSLLRGYSAGDHPAARPHPMALELLRGFGFATGFAKPQDWAVFARAGAPEVHLILQVCDRDPDPPQPRFPLDPPHLRWPMPDPAAEQCGREARRRAFLEAYRTLERRIEALLTDVSQNGPLSLREGDAMARIAECGTLSAADTDLDWPS